MPAPSAQLSASALSASPSLDEARLRLQPPPRRRAPVWPLVVAAAFAAVMGVSVAAVTIFGPGGGEDAGRTGSLHHALPSSWGSESLRLRSRVRG